MQTWVCSMRRLIVSITAVVCVFAQQPSDRRHPNSRVPDVKAIVRKSAETAKADRLALHHYDYSERDKNPDGSSKTYAVRMLFGSPYRELQEVNGKPLSSEDRKQEREKFERESARRRRESPSERTHRVEAYDKEEKRDARFFEQISQAFDFKFAGEEQIHGHRVYLLQAMPRAEYKPPDKESAVLTGMRGQLWVDEKAYHWARVEAEVIHPVSIDGFLAKVEPGTHFELENVPVGENIWLPAHFAMKSKAKVLSLIENTRQEDETYFNYHRSGRH
jgi:hypothetical protein